MKVGPVYQSAPSSLMIEIHNDQGIPVLSAPRSMNKSRHHHSRRPATFYGWPSTLLLRSLWVAWVLTEARPRQVSRTTPYKWMLPSLSFPGAGPRSRRIPLERLTASKTTFVTSSRWVHSDLGQDHRDDHETFMATRSLVIRGGGGKDASSSPRVTHVDFPSTETPSAVVRPHAWIRSLWTYQQNWLFPMSRRSFLSTDRRDSTQQTWRRLLWQLRAGETVQQQPPASTLEKDDENNRDKKKKENPTTPAVPQLNTSSTTVITPTTSGSVATDATANSSPTRTTAAATKGAHMSQKSRKISKKRRRRKLQKALDKIRETPSATISQVSSSTITTSVTKPTENIEQAQEPAATTRVAGSSNQSVTVTASATLTASSKNGKATTVVSRSTTSTSSISISSSRASPSTSTRVHEVKNVTTKRKRVKLSTAKKQKSSSALLAHQHLQQDLKSNNPNYRIQKELRQFLRDPPPHLSVQVGKNIRVWIVTMKGAPGTIYEGETFLLRISFPPAYPTVPPSVYFLPPHIPLHEHVYTNGDICLSLLGKDWRPTLTAQSIAVSILSILSSAQSKSLPMDNARHAQNKPGEYQKDWVYHDDNC